MALDSLSVFDTRSDFAPLKACRTEAHHLLHDFDRGRAAAISTFEELRLQHARELCQLSEQASRGGARRYARLSAGARTLAVEQPRGNFFQAVVRST